MLTHKAASLYVGPVGMGVAMAIGLFDRLDSVAMVPTHVWDAVPGDVVSSVILATAAATSAKMDINQYRDSKIGNSEDPLVVHAGVCEQLIKMSELPVEHTWCHPLLPSSKQATSKKFYCLQCSTAIHQQHMSM